MKRRQPERDLHVQVADYLNALPSIGYFGWHHTPNGGSRNVIEAARMKRLGVKAGYPDIRIDRPGKYAMLGAAIELKAGKGRPSPAQMKWLQALSKSGVRVAVCRSLDEVRAVLEQWGYLCASRH